MRSVGETLPTGLGDDAVEVRYASLADADALARLRHALWPDGSEAEHRREIERFFAGGQTAPLTSPAQGRHRVRGGQKSCSAASASRNRRGGLTRVLIVRDLRTMDCPRNETPDPRDRPGPPRASDEAPASD
jgi:hypothetical protein